MVVIRFSRVGRHATQVFRLVAADQRFKRDGRCLEIIGFYDPRGKSQDTKFRCDEARVRHWLSVGAQPSVQVWTHLKKVGIKKEGCRKAPTATSAA
jgi:small subunit ribosomal protein S16